jgi:hypothetical protein
VATAIALFGFLSGAALATVVGVLVEVPAMLSVVPISCGARAVGMRRRPPAGDSSAIGLDDWYWSSSSATTGTPPGNASALRAAIRVFLCEGSGAAVGLTGGTGMSPRTGEEAATNVTEIMGNLPINETFGWDHPVSGRCSHGAGSGPHEGTAPLI